MEMVRGVEGRGACVRVLAPARPAGGFARENQGRRVHHDVPNCVMHELQLRFKYLQLVAIENFSRCREVHACRGKKGLGKLTTSSVSQSCEG